MLVDVSFCRPTDTGISLALSFIGNGKLIPERIGEGMYQCGHWSIDLLGVPIRERWREDGAQLLDFDEYGVCDAPEQAIEKLGLRARPERFFVTFVRIRRDEQDASGGWRWHKWGPYIGTQEPKCEYIHDEPEIEEVFTYHVYELKQ